ncbi:MAG: Holliday junction branch migration protein RuvA [Chloroflexota bacterium]|jgi:Holliday junction DNA helicase RuvA
MIASISGVVSGIGKDNLIINVGGVGVRVHVPRSVLEKVAGTGRQLSLVTHLIVRETELTLYGFEKEEELGLFQVLLDVNGVGPKVALSMLSTLSIDVLKGAIVREESAVLQRVPGIGKKTSERIMFHLRDKLDLTAELGATPFISDEDSDVIDILTSLGFSIVEAQSALQNIPRETEGVDARVQAALQYLDRS